MITFAPKLFNPAGRIAIVGYGSVDPLGHSDTSYLTRIGRFEDAVPEFARLMGLVEARGGQLYAREIIQAGRRVEAPAALKEKPLEQSEILRLYRDYIDRHVGIRVIEPGDAMLDFDPQRFVQWIEVVLKEETVINGVTYARGERLRIKRVVKMGASHAGVLPSGWNLSQEAGFSGPNFKKMGRAHLIMMRALTEAVIRMGVPWQRIAQRIPRENRGVAAANGIASLDYLQPGMENPTLGRPIVPHQLERYISDVMGFDLGKATGAGWAATRTAACNTGPANVELLLSAMRTRDILFGAVATVEAAIGAPSVEAFLRKKALADDRAVTRLRDHASLVSRPALPDRSGFVMGEGGGLILLMNMELALELGVLIYGELLVCETAMGAPGKSDPAAPTAGVEAVMRRAIRKAAELDGISPQEVVRALDFIHSHGTSTPAGDLNAIRCYDSLLGEYGRDPRDPVAVVYGKGGPRLDGIPTARQAGGNGVGHLLGGAGLQALVETLQIFLYGILPPSVAGLALVDPTIAGARHVYFPTNPVEVEVEVAKVDAQGFGDSNGEVWLRRFREGRYIGGRETSSARAEAAAWRGEQMEAVRGGRMRPADFLPKASEI